VAQPILCGQVLWVQPPASQCTLPKQHLGPCSPQGFNGFHPKETVEATTKNLPTQDLEHKLLVATQSYLELKKLYLRMEMLVLGVDDPNRKVTERTVVHEQLKSLEDYLKQEGVLPKE
jgi:hypothetical protein